MEPGLEIIRNQVRESGCYCMRSMKKHPGYENKVNWTESQLDHGLSYVQIKQGKKVLGFIEYAPGESSWRAVHADGYLVIHCLWVGVPGMGIGSRLIQLCLEEARERRMKGVAVLTNPDTGWAPSKDIFVKNGFSQVEHGPYSFELYAYTFPDASASAPYFPTDWDARLQRFSQGLTILRTDQCPYLEVATDNLLEAAKAARIEPHIIHIESRAQMMALSPTPYGVFNVVYNGELIAYHRMTARSFYKKLTS